MPEDRNKVIADHLPYARARGRWWGSKFPSLRDDLMAVAMLALVQALDAEPYPRNPKGYISRCIDNRVRSFLRNNYLIKIPSHEIKRRRAASQSLDDLPRAHPDENIERRGQEAPAWLRLHAADICRLLKLSPFEQEVIELRMYGYTQAEIGAILNTTQPTICKALTAIQERYSRIAAIKHNHIKRPND